MDWKTESILLAAGVLGGIINAVAGGATLITFPAMLAVGLPPVAANASNAVAIAPGHLIAAVADRKRLPAFDRALAASLFLCLIGGAIGALILLALPDRLFILPVPALIGFATLLFAFAPRIAAWAERRRAGAAASRLGGLAGLAAASVYGGFFGAGLGVILTAVLSISGPTDLRKVQVLKNLLASAVTLVAVTIFIIQGMVRWRETLPMLFGALIGGYAGGHLVRILPSWIVRLIVIASGVVMTVAYARRYWL